MALLEVQELSIDLLAKDQPRRLVDDVSFSVAEGEAFCLIGESGSGKSLTALALTRLLAPETFCCARGTVRLKGRDLWSLSPADLRSVRGAEVSYIFQDPVAYLNPVLRVGQQIMEMLRLHQPSKANRGRLVELLEMVGIPSPSQRIDDYPHEMSGGMLQRVMIAMALASEPALLIADEPTTALDVTIQAQILRLLRNLQEQLGMSVMLISHNLGVVEEFGSRMAVMYAGQIVEMGETSEVLSQPKHPYTAALMRAMPRLGIPQTSLYSLPGQVPLAGNFPTGCRFHPRCSRRLSSCAEDAPELVEEGNRWFVRCPVTQER